MDLCSRCAGIPFRTLFGTSRKPRKRQIGSLTHALKNRSSCCFCNFLVEAYELGHGLRRGHLAIDNQDTTLGFQILARANSGPSNCEEPWPERAGLSIDGQTGPALWLQFTGVNDKRIELADPFVCVSCSPAEKKPGNSAGLRPRRRRPDDVAKCELELANLEKWLRICTTEHTGLCKRSTTFKRQILNLRLIDVNNWQVKVVDHDEPYVALSYVWGNTLKEDCKKFWNSSDPNARCIELPDQLPQTIEDAITFTKRIGMKFLWVDAFCINQEDDHELQSQLANMNLVFECSWLTIAAVDSEDAYFGLYGVSKNFERYWQPQTKIPYGDFMATYVHEVWSWQGKSPWEKRAWVLQELLLSPRVLFFNKHYMTMRCDSEFFVDLLEVDSSPSRALFKQSDSYFWENGFDTRLYKKSCRFLEFDVFLANYTRRTLKDPNDVLSACLGALIQITTNTGLGFLQGLPKAYFHLALLWKPHHEAMLVQRRQFPSWSWTGWFGRIEHHYCLDDLDAYEEHGPSERHKQMQKKAKHWPFEPQNVMKYDEAIIYDEGDNTLRVSTKVARVTVKKVRQKGQTMEGIMADSEQAKTAVGDHWVLLDSMGKPIRNEVGEVARFEDIDYSFQVGPTISDELDRVKGKCELIFIKFFPYLRDNRRKAKSMWIFDYVGCLVTFRRQNNITRQEVERIGFVFIKLEDWINYDPQAETVSIV